MKSQSLTTKTVSAGKARLRIGVDIGGNDIKLGATNVAADQIMLPDLVKRPSLTLEGPQPTIHQILDGIAAVLSRLGAAWTEVASIAVTVPCPCTADGVILEATNLGSAATKELWKRPFGKLLADAVRTASGYDIPVFACNDANAAGQDDDFERFGLDTRTRTSVFITTGTGLGGCVLVNGSVLFGRGQAGELGHVKPAVPAAYAERFADDVNPPCGCGARQCVEARASLTGLLRRLPWALSPAGAASIQKQLQTRGQEVSAEVLAQLRQLYQQSPQSAAYEVRTFADRPRDPFCRWLLEDWAIMIGALFANLAPVLHPDLFIIGGGLTELSAEARAWFIGIVRKVYGEVNGQACFNGQAPENLDSLGNCHIDWAVSQDQGWRGAILMAVRAEQQALTQERQS
jgi:predicted NBD/HSP70 family sugar kinase